MNDLNAIESACFVFELEDPYFHYIRTFGICTFDPIQGPILRQLLTNNYNKEVLNINIENDPDLV
jgi:hypothetical protein